MIHTVRTGAVGLCRVRVDCPICGDLDEQGAQARREPDVALAVEQGVEPDEYRRLHGEPFGAIMASDDLNVDIRGWWRITETSQWVNDGLDDLGPAMISITGHGDRLRMHYLLAHVNVRPTKTGAAFSWEGAWEYDPMTGTGTVRLGKDGKLRGRIRIKDGDESTFLADRATQPAEPIPNPPSYRDKWRPGRR
jgi:hypothetical protein